jgi:hypothetical protein
LQGFSLQRFTCNVQTNFAALDLFSTQSGKITLCQGLLGGANHITIEISANDAYMSAGLALKSISQSRASQKLVKPYLELLDFLEPTHARRSLLGVSDDILIQSMCWRSYTQSTLRWKTALTILQPELTREHIDSLDACHKDSTQKMLAVFAERSLYRNTSAAIIYLCSIYEDVCSLKFLDTADQPAVRHFQSAIEHRLTFLYGVMLSQQPSGTKSEHKKRALGLGAIGALCKTLWILPLQYSQYSGEFGWHLASQLSFGQCNVPQCAPEKPQNAWAAPPSFSTWATNSIPIACLRLFGLDPETFRDRLRSVGDRYDQCEVTLRSLFDDFDGQQDSLELTIVYRGIVAILLRIYLDYLTTDWSPCYLGRHWDIDIVKIHGPVMTEISIVAMTLCSDFMERYTTETQSFDRAMEDMEDWIHKQAYTKWICKGFERWIWQASVHTIFYVKL